MSNMKLCSSPLYQSRQNSADFAGVNGWTFPLHEKYLHMLPDVVESILSIPNRERGR